MSVSRRAFLSTSGAALAAARLPAQDPTVDDEIRKLAESAPLSMRFAGSTAEECRRWQEAFSAKLKAALGPHDPPAAWKTTVRSAVELDDHRREELLLEAEGHPALPVYLLLPKKGEGPRPGVVALHGHGDHGHHPVAGRDDLPGVAASIENARYDYGRQFARRGYAVAVPCLTPFGQRLGKKEAYGNQDPCAVTFVRLQLLGKVLLAENIRDARWAVSLLAGHGRVDPQRIGCAGLSYGGRTSMFLAALEPRIRVAAVSGALNVMQERVRGRYSCGAQVVPGLLGFGDVPEVGSLIAPRPCVWELGSKDGLIKPEWTAEALARMRRAYAALGARDALAVDLFEGGHRWNGEAAYPAFEKALSP